MKETKIKGLKILYNDNQIIINNFYLINNKEKMQEILEIILKKNEFYDTKRDINNFINEWKTKNRLYKISIFKKHHKNIILKNKINKFFNYTYNLCGIGGK